MLTLNEFAERVKDEASQKLGTCFCVQIQQSLKNNGQLCTQLAIQQLGEPINMRFSLDEDFEMHRADTDDNKVANVVEGILKIYEGSTAMTNSVKTWIPDISDYRKIKDKVVYKLVNLDMNQELLRSVPHVPYLDLAIVFYINLGEYENGKMNALIYNHHLSMWGITIGDLMEDARKNTPQREPYKFLNLQTVVRESIAERTGIPVELLGDMDMPDEESPIYYLSNSTGQYGASAILYTGIMRQCAEKIGGDLVLFPSSTHEMLLMRREKNMNADELSAMVKDINESDVPETDVLSNNVYYYHYDEDKLEIAK